MRGGVALLKCPECGQHALLRYQCLSPLEHLLALLRIYPFRCQVCSHRFLSFSMGRSYPTHTVDRREHVRVPVRLQLAFSGGRMRGEGHVLNLSVGGCMIETNVTVHRDDIYHLELFVTQDQPPLELPAIVRSVTGKRVGLKFLASAREDQRLLALIRAKARAQAELLPE
jgi:hypothetical protein